MSRSLGTEVTKVDSRRKRKKKKRITSIDTPLVWECVQQVFPRHIKESRFWRLLELGFNTRESAPYMQHFLHNNDDEK